MTALSGCADVRGSNPMCFWLISMYTFGFFLIVHLKLDCILLTHILCAVE